MITERDRFVVPIRLSPVRLFSCAFSVYTFLSAAIFRFSYDPPFVSEKSAYPIGYHQRLIRSTFLFVTTLGDSFVSFVRYTVLARVRRRASRSASDKFSVFVDLFSRYLHPDDSIPAHLDLTGCNGLKERLRSNVILPTLYRDYPNAIILRLPRP